MLGELDVLALLDEAGVSYTLVRHPAIFTVDEAKALGMDHAGAVPCKNLFLRCDKKRNYYLVVCPEDTHVDLRLLQERLQSRRLSFASAADLGRLLGLIPGAVTPLGVLNDAGGRVLTVLDETLKDQRIECHPLTNTATVTLATSDLVRLLEGHGHAITWCAVGA